MAAPSILSKHRTRPEVKPAHASLNEPRGLSQHLSIVLLYTVTHKSSYIFITLNPKSPREQTEAWRDSLMTVLLKDTLIMLSAYDFIIGVIGY